jgi:hypothetical protein
MGSLTFTWLNKQTVKSNLGFVVQFTGRFTAEYREGSKTITLHFENGRSCGMSCVILSEFAFERWDNDPPGVIITNTERERLLKNFRDACEFQGLKVT